MKHPLTSKERRGLVAVAAAALLCIASGFIFRNCSSRYSDSSRQVVIVDDDSVSTFTGSHDSVSAKTVARKHKRNHRSDSVNGKRARRLKRQKAERVYPSRSPLDQPCDN